MHKLLLRAVCFGLCYTSAGLHGAAELSQRAQINEAVNKIREIIDLQKQACWRWELADNYKNVGEAETAKKLEAEAEKRMNAFRVEHSLAVRQAAIGELEVREYDSHKFLTK